MSGEDFDTDIKALMEKYGVFAIGYALYGAQDGMVFHAVNRILCCPENEKFQVFRMLLAQVDILKSRVLQALLDNDERIGISMYTDEDVKASTGADNEHNDGVN